MYTNTDNDSNKLDTQYSVEYKLNIGYSSIIDKIVIKEDGYKFGDANADNSIVNKKISINKDNLVQLIGEDGLIKLAADGHGGIYESLVRTKMTNKMRELGIKWI